MTALHPAQRVNNATVTLQGEVTRHRLTACNQEQRASTPTTGTAHAETTIQTSPLGFQAQERREKRSE